MKINKQQNNLFGWAFLLLCLIGANLSWADVWDGVSRVRPETATIDGKTYFLIESAANLVWFSDSVNETTNGNVGINAKVVAEYIDLGRHPFTPIAAGKGDTKYTGIFDGNGVTIANLYIDSTSLGEVQCSYEQNVGLFGTQGGGSIIKDVILENVYLSANANRGFACGAGKDLQISVGPVVGWQSGGTISGCFASGLIYSTGLGQGVGGIVGTSSGKIVDCLSVVSINASGEDGHIGGILGYAENSTVESSVYDGNSLVNTSDKMVGGIVGKVREDRKLTTDRCYFDSDVAVNGGVANGSSEGETPLGVNDVNTQEIVCSLNDGTWENGCTVAAGAWSNGVNITNNGVSKNAEGETVFLIQFNANGGYFASGAKTAKILKFNALLTADEISRPSYGDSKVFLGWSKDSTAVEPDSSLGIVYGKKTIYAVWRNLQTFMVTFDYNNSAGPMTVNKWVVENEVITTDGFAPEDLPTTYVDGSDLYYFAGWSESRTGPVLDHAVKATRNIVFYAQWSLSPKYTVTFDMNGHGQAVPTLVVDQGMAAVAPSPAPTVDGYVFEGWFVESSCTTPFDFETPITENLTLYAKWTPESYNIVYELDGGTNSSDNPSTYTIETESFLLADPTKEEYLFGGWFYDSSRTSPATQITTGTMGHKTLYAKWVRQSYPVVYNGGTRGKGIVDRDYKLYGDSLKLSTDIYSYSAGKYRVSFLHDGWTLSDGGSKVYDLGGLYLENKAVTLYPYWSKRVKVRYGEESGDEVWVNIDEDCPDSMVSNAISAALLVKGINLPVKELTKDSLFVLKWVSDSLAIYDYTFVGLSRPSEIVVAYDTAATDTIHIPLDKDLSLTDEALQELIKDAFANHDPVIPLPTKKADSLYTYQFEKFVQNSETGIFEPLFAKLGTLYKINFHLPEMAELMEFFDGYRLGEVTLLPKAVMTDDPTWIFKGWYTRSKGRGDHVKAMRETDYGNKSLYPLFQKTLRYDANGNTGVIEVIYTPEADTVIARALSSVIPGDYTKNKKTYTFDKWVLEDGVYTARFKEVGASFYVFSGSRSLTIEQAKIGARLTVFDMGGRMVKRGVVSNGSQRVDLPKSGSYTVRVNQEAVQVNVR